MISELAEDIDIESPAKAHRVVESLKELLERGIIKEVTGTCKISDIQSGRPWPNDIIEIELVEIATKYKFKLTIETYHGAGGSFKRLA